MNRAAIYPAGFSEVVFGNSHGKLDRVLSIELACAVAAFENVAS